jgi:hypothetical protein
VRGLRQHEDMGPLIVGLIGSPIMQQKKNTVKAPVGRSTCVSNAVTWVGATALEGLVFPAATTAARGKPCTHEHGRCVIRVGKDCGVRWTGCTFVEVGDHTKASRKHVVDTAFATTTGSVHAAFPAAGRVPPRPAGRPNGRWGMPRGPSRRGPGCSTASVPCLCSPQRMRAANTPHNMPPPPCVIRPLCICTVGPAD